MILLPKINNVLAKIKCWREISRQRSQLRKMSDAFLMDVGISRADADREAERPFWDSAPIEDISLRSRTGTASDIDREEGECCIQT